MKERIKKIKFSDMYLFLILLMMYLPIFIVIIYSFNSSRITSIWEGFSLKWYTELFKDRALADSLKNSLFLATVASLSAGIIGTLGALGMSKLQFSFKGLFEHLSSIPIMTPEVIMGMVFLAFFGLINLPPGMLALVIAHTSFSIPYVYMMVKARLVGMDDSYAEAARDLGATPMRAFWDITLPAILPAIVSGMLLAFAMSMDDVVISIFVTGPTSNTLPIRIYTQLKTGVSPKINALCTLMFAATVLIVGVAGIVRRKGQTHRDFSKEETYEY